MYKDAGLALTIAMNVAPSSAVQQAFAAIYRECQANNVDPTVSILGAILDGMRHGNWPVTS